MMSVSNTHWLLLSFTKPIEMPATGLLIGTPAAIKPSVAPQTLAMELEPFDSRMSEMTRTVYGNESGSGNTGFTLRSAKAPWPISRRPGPLMRLTSPTENELHFYSPMLQIAIEEARQGLAEGGIPIGAALFASDGNLLGRQSADWQDPQSEGRTKIDCSHIRSP